MSGALIVISVIAAILFGVVFLCIGHLADLIDTLERKLK